MTTQTLRPKPSKAQEAGVFFPVGQCDRCGKLLARLPVAEGRFALVHQEDAIALRGMRFSLHTSRVRKNGTSLVYPRSTRSCIRLHRAIAALHLGSRIAGVQIDHSNQDTLDNRWECNLQPATHAENIRNRGVSASNRSGFRGVYQNRRGKFIAQIRVNGKAFRLGTFERAVDAAAAWNKRARLEWGDRVFLNPIPVEAIEEVSA